MSISTDNIVRLAHADIALHMAFPRSVGYFHGPLGKMFKWKVMAGDCEPLVIGKNDAVAIDGNCSYPVSAPEGGLIHVYGDVSSAIDTAGHSEVVVTGNVLRSATINATGLCHLFVDGDVEGEIRSSDSLKLWIGKDFTGLIQTGRPSTDVYINGNYRGGIVPGKETALLWLTVCGFASHASLCEIVDHHYTQFNASIGASDVPPGLYPENGHLKKADGGNSFNRWCVREESAGMNGPGG